ncbi:ImmA/IrrE family metallo-endopeptidase [Proteus mirabilis]|nr:toxin [Proteus mirabilis]MBG3131426.1 ImmA/IrrE family metallo-endopeptidase [Proteus mirabilis]MBI6486123.1 ImmA/IrrE family metallo-endopeptidase [Proteus mirabilis]MBN7150363.1 ImmA/IrrE family metallo-endopeptidase [Proteus mirabilis]MBN7154230.1 ImmA/IrrE family metallo-endopeptidase [Proteus mirabilis]
MNEIDIARKAVGFCQVFKLINKRKKNRTFDKIFESFTEYGITLDSIEDKEWEKLTYDLTIGHFDPTTWTISVPNRVYVNACKGEKDALFIIMHELGHLFLGHRPVLHKSNKPPVECEDAEWQADTFAEFVLEQLGYETRQMTFDFYM